MTEPIAPGWFFVAPFSAMPAENTGSLIIYFDTDDIESSIARVRELGGSADDRQPIPGIGWFTHCKDTEGNAFSLFQSDESANA